MKIKQVSKDRVTVTDASKVLNLSILSVQGALKNSALPIGGAWKNEGSDCYTYYISAYQLSNFMGITKEELLERIEQNNNGGMENEKINYRKRIG